MTMSMNLRRSFLAAVVALLAPGAAGAHEFWISPVHYQIDAGEKIIADTRIGQNFSGAPRALLPFFYTRFDIVMGAEAMPVEGRTGDLPALDMAAPDAGLAVIVHQTTDSYVQYEEWEKFVSLAESKGFPEVLAEHGARGLPREGFRENYRRYAKSLVAVGDGAGADAALGLEVEIVAEANPYTDDLSGGFPVRVIYDGVAHADAQLMVFSRDAAGEVSETAFTTDSEGRALLPVEAGNEYLLDSVVMRPAPPADGPNAPVWESLWASLTFRVPSR